VVRPCLGTAAEVQCCAVKNYMGLRRNNATAEDEVGSEWSVVESCFESREVGRMVAKVWDVSCGESPANQLPGSRAIRSEASIQPCHFEFFGQYHFVPDFMARTANWLMMAFRFHLPRRQNRPPHPYRTKFALPLRLLHPSVHQSMARRLRLDPFFVFLSMTD